MYTGESTFSDCFIIDLLSISDIFLSLCRPRQQEKRPDSPDPGVAELEAKLQELRRIGDKIKEQAVSMEGFTLPHNSVPAC